MSDVTVDLPLRRNRSFQLLWAGEAVSALGSQATNIAMPLLILFITGSPALAGVATACKILATVVISPFAGVWVDRHDRRRILVTGLGLQATALAVFGVMVVTDLVNIWHVVVLATISGAIVGITDPAFATAVRAVVPTSQLSTAFAQNNAREYGATLAGRPLGGVLYSLSRALPFLFDALTYLVSLICVLTARIPRRPAQTAEQSASTVDRTFRGDLLDALNWLKNQPGLRAAISFVFVVNLLLATLTLPLIVLVGERGGSAVDIGLVLAGMGVGGLLGSLLASKVGRLVRPGRLLVSAAGMFGLMMLAMTIPLGPWWPIVPLMAGMLAVPIVNVVIVTLVSILVPEQMLGRLSALLNAISTGISPLGPLIGGIVSQAVGGAQTLLISGTLLTVISAAAALSRPLRSLSVPVERHGSEQSERS